MSKVHPLPFDLISPNRETQNLINQNPENPFSEAHLFAPFVDQAEQLSLTHSVMRPRAGQTGLWANITNPAHKHTSES